MLITGLFLCSTLLRNRLALATWTALSAASREVAFCQNSYMDSQTSLVLVWGVSVLKYLLRQTHLLSLATGPMRHAVACGRPFWAGVRTGEMD